MVAGFSTASSHRGETCVPVEPKTGDIHLFGFSQESDGLRMNLGEELARGAHYFDLPNIREQLGSAPHLCSRACAASRWTSISPSRTASRMSRRSSG